MDYSKVSGPFIHPEHEQETSLLCTESDDVKDEEDSNQINFLEVAERFLGKTDMVNVTLQQITEEMKAEMAQKEENNHSGVTEQLPREEEISDENTSSENMSVEKSDVNVNDVLTNRCESKKPVGRVYIFEKRGGQISLKTTDSGTFNLAPTNDSRIFNLAPTTYNDSIVSKPNVSIDQNNESEHGTLQFSESSKQENTKVIASTSSADNQENSELDLELDCNSSIVSDQRAEEGTSLRTKTDFDLDCGSSIVSDQKMEEDTNIRTEVEKTVNKLCLKTDMASQTFYVAGNLFKVRKTVKASEPSKTRNTNIKNINISDRELPYKCRFCDEVFSLFTQLKRHTDTHIKDAQFTCETCQRVYVCEKDLKKHMKKHAMPTPHKCNECGKSFRQNHQLEKHSRIHSGDKPFLCETCGMGFAQKENLRLHERTHSGYKPHKCAICGKTFNSTKVLHRHELSHSGERNYKCETCGKTYQRNDHLRRHKRIHGEEPRFNCSYCGRGFHQKVNLEEHERIHTGTKPFVCEVCGKSFTQRGNLKTHFVKHTFV